MSKISSSDSTLHLVLLAASTSLICLAKGMCTLTDYSFVLALTLTTAEFSWDPFVFFGVKGKEIEGIGNGYSYSSIHK